MTLAAIAIGWTVISFALALCLARMIRKGE